MRPEESFEILSKIHEYPAAWLLNLYPFSGQQLSMFAGGCETLLLHGVPPEQVRSMVDQNLQVVEFLIDGHYDRALRLARALASGEIYSPNYRNAKHWLIKELPLYAPRRRRNSGI
jgi:hypothetical protein